jgi:DNA-binding CsgD family transcriptional regulator
MDEIDYLSTVNLLTQNHSLEGRLKLVLEKTRSYLNLDACSIQFVPDNGSDFYIISSNESLDQVREQKGEYSLDATQGLEDSEAAVFRLNKSSPSQNGGEQGAIFTHKLRVKSVAGADFRLHKNLEVRLRLMRNHEQGEFSAAEINLIEQVMASIRGTISTAIHERHQAIFDASAQKLLTHLRIGMFILNQGLEILEKSALADELIGKIRAFHYDEKLLAGKTREYQAKLDRTMEELTNNPALLYKIVDIVAAEKGDQYTLVIAKSIPESAPLSESIFLGYIFSCPEDFLSCSTLLNMWQISPAERRVLTAIARFDNIKKVALELNISPNTAKAQLKSVYKKLGVGSKMRLMKRLNLLRNIEALTG